MIRNFKIFPPMKHHRFGTNIFAVWTCLTSHAGKIVTCVGVPEMFLCTMPNSSQSAAAAAEGPPPPLLSVTSYTVRYM